MSKKAILSLFLSMITAGIALPAHAEQLATHSCVAAPNLRPGMSLSRCYERSDLTQLKGECGYLKGEIHENTPCPSGHYAACLPKKPGEFTEYLYMPDGKKPSPFQLESGKEMCELKQNIWKVSQ